MLRTVLTCVMSLLFAVPSFAATIQFFPGANDFRIASVSDLDVGGTLYDVAFHTNMSWDAFKAASPTTYLPFNTSADASTANDALRDAINAALIDASSGGGGANRTFNIFVAYAEGATTFSADSIFNLQLNPLTYGSGANKAFDSSLDMNSPNLTQAFTTWTEVTSVPEPATLLLLGTGLVAVRLRLKKRT